MKKKIIACIYILILVVCFKPVFNYFYNQSMVKYDEEGYLVNAKPLLFMNFYQPYIAHYNNGNCYYHEKDYQAAIDEYQAALRANPPKKKECSVRINLALAMIKQLGDDYAEPDKVQDSIATLEEARKILLEDDCATELGDGHSETAEELKLEIEKILEELKKQQNNEENPSEDDKKEDEQNNADDEYENNLKEELQQQQSEAYQERQEQMQFYEEMDMEYNWDYGEVIW